MLKRILLTLVMLLVIAYLAVAITLFNRRPSDRVCRDIELTVTDSIYAGFITPGEVKALLSKKGINPIGREPERIHTKTLEQELAKHPLIDRVECYVAPSGRLNIELTQRIPVLRVMSVQGENYYIDNKGTVMPTDARCVARVPIATGYVGKSFAMRDLHKFALFLQNNSFWNAQIEQINVTNRQKIELVPRVGNHIIYLGDLHQYEQKLQRVKEFYRKALNRVGWNRYSRINAEFDNQIICTKR